MLKNLSFRAGHAFGTEILEAQPVIPCSIIEARASRHFFQYCRSKGARRPALHSFLDGCRQAYRDFHQVAL